MSCVQSYNEICDLVEAGVVLNSSREFVNAASLDLTLGRRVLIESRGLRGAAQEVSLGKREPLNTVALDIDPARGFLLYPGEFVLCQTEQVFNLPDWLSAEYKLKSSMARVGLEHLNAGWADAGWNGSVLTLEFKNMTRHHGIRLFPGDRIGQMIFYRHAEVPEHASYRNKGAYNGHTQVTGAQPKKA